MKIHDRRKTQMKLLALIVLLGSTVYADCRVVDVLQTIRPQAQWSLSGDVYGGLKWLDATQSKPTAAEVQAATAACQANAATRASHKSQARLDAKNARLTPDQRVQAMSVLLDLDK